MTATLIADRQVMPQSVFFSQRDATTGPVPTLSIKYLASRRGYVSMRLDRHHVRADFKTMPYVTTPSAPISTGRSYVIPVGEPGLNQVGVTP